MEEHQNNTDTDVQDNQADSGEGTPKVIKAGNEAKPGRRVLRGGGASNGGNPTDASDHSAAEAARSILRAGQQTMEGAKEAPYAAFDAAESTDGGQVLGEWASFVRRVSLRNMQAMGDLMHCYTFHSLLQWQSNLLSATVADLWDTNARLLQSVTRKA